jgi:hypothetical protein
MFVGPVTHVACDLITQQQIRDARRDAVAKAAARGVRRSLRDRLLRRQPTPRVADPAALVPRGDDVWHSLRY